MIPSGPITIGRLTRDNTTSVVIDGRLLPLEPHSTQEWLAALSEGHLGLIFPGMLHISDFSEMWIRLMDDDDGLDLDTLQLASHAVVAEVCAMPWYGAVRLSVLLSHHFIDLESAALAKGIDLLEVPVRQALGSIWSLLRGSLSNEESKLAEFDRDLWAPVALKEGETPKWAPEQQAQSFAAFRAARGGARAGR